MADLKATEKAIEKYNLLVNGSKNEVDRLFQSIAENRLNESELIRIKSKSQISFFYKKCGDTYIVLAKESNFWGFMDVLAKKEVEDLVGCSI